MRSYNPHDIVRQIRVARISVLVSRAEDPRRPARVRRARVSRRPPSRDPAECTLAAALVALSPRSIALFGWKFWAFVVRRGAARRRARGVLGRLGFVVVQGYGLTETAPIVTLNHPFKTSRGSVGKPIAGVEVRIADDGEILVRGDNVTHGLLTARHRERRRERRSRTAGCTPATSASIDAEGRLFIRGRKKEMIVTPEGLNVFPEDVERALNAHRRA